MHYILGHILFYGLIGSILDMTELLMCSGVSSIIQQLAELMSQARSQRQARARGQPGWPERQKVCIWNRAGTRLSWSSRSWRSTQAGPGPLLLLRGPHGELPPRKEQAPGLQNNVGQGNRCWSSLDLKIPKWGASRNRKYWGMLVFWAGLLIAVAIHLKRNILKDRVYWDKFQGHAFQHVRKDMNSWAWRVASGHRIPEDKQEVELARHPHDLPPATPFLLTVLQPSPTAPSAGTHAQTHKLVGVVSHSNHNIPGFLCTTHRAGLEEQPTHTHPRPLAHLGLDKLNPWACTWTRRPIV